MSTPKQTKTIGSVVASLIVGKPAGPGAPDRYNGKHRRTRKLLPGTSGRPTDNPPPPAAA